MIRAFGSGISVIILLLALQLAAAGQDVGVMEYTADNVPVLECDSYQNLLPLYRYCHTCSDNETTYGEGGCRFRSGPGEFRCCHPTIQSANENSRPQFVYKLTLSNEGPKTIRAVEWEYIFIDPQTQLEVARRQFLSQEKVSPRKRKKLVEYSTSPPTKVISVDKLLQPESKRFIERVVIKRVTYQDGSVWEPQRFREKGLVR